MFAVATTSTAGETGMLARKNHRIGFTLIELLVVIAIIALLVAILLPSLNGARKQGMAVKCGTNLHHVSQAMTMYLGENSGVFPLSYIYTEDGSGNWQPDTQPVDHPYGYLHWSYYLYNNGKVDSKAFQCPDFTNGGAPRTNPGRAGWEEGQVDQNGSAAPNELEDRQAERMAYTGNAAVFPRNKFTQLLSGGQRVNRFVTEKEVAPNVILASEFNRNWKAIGIADGSGVLSKSHRPVNPFQHVGSGSNEYAAPVNTPGFTYGNGPYYGVLSKSQVESAVDLIDNPGLSEMNAIGRHHPGDDGYTGGSANFLYVDGHVEKKTVLQSLINREWGTRYYAVNGSNTVGPPWN